MRAFMHEYALADTHPDDGFQIALAVGDFEQPGFDGQGRVDGVAGDIGQPQVYGIQVFAGDAFDSAGLVGNAKDDDAATGVGKGGEFVGDAVPARLIDLVTLDRKTLEFIGRVFAETDLVEEFADEVGGGYHGNAFRRAVPREA